MFEKTVLRDSERIKMYLQTPYARRQLEYACDFFLIKG